MIPKAETDLDVAVIGGGLVGSAIALGLFQAGQRVALLDEGDAAIRASRANFALVWVQSKGLGLPEYAGWTILSSEAWGEFADSGVVLALDLEAELARWGAGSKLQ